MEGLVQEGAEVMEEDLEGAVLDAALIGAAQRVEHYEIAAYGTVCEFAKVLGEMKHASLLEKTLEEESQTDQKLTKLAKKINAQANEATSSQEDEEDSAKPGRRSPKHAA
jgi:ferritin-like metal-binding protein YciE